MWESQNGNVYRKSSVYSLKEAGGGKSPPFGHDEFVDSTQDLTSNYPKLLFFATAQQLFSEKKKVIYYLYFISKLNAECPCFLD